MLKTEAGDMGTKGQMIWKVEYEWYMQQLKYPQVGTNGDNDKTFKNKVGKSAERKNRSMVYEESQIQSTSTSAFSKATQDQISEYIEDSSSQEESQDEDADEEWRPNLKESGK